MNDVPLRITSPSELIGCLRHFASAPIPEHPNVDAADTETQRQALFLMVVVNYLENSIPEVGRENLCAPLKRLCSEMMNEVQRLTSGAMRRHSIHRKLALVAQESPMSAIGWNGDPRI